MTEPIRWLEDRRTSAQLRQVMAASSEPPPLPAELHARLSELAVGLASQSLLAQVGGVSLWRKLLSGMGGAGSAGSAGKALLLGSLIGAAGAGTYVASRASAPLAVRASRALRTPRAAAVPALPDRAPLQPPASASASALAPQEDAPSGAAARTRAANAAPSALAEPRGLPTPAQASASARSNDESIADEAKLLETARSFLGDSPALALELTEQHRRLHPAAQLSAEREFIAVEALLRLGRRQEAERRAAPRLEQAPDSLYARRMRQLLTPAGEAPPKSENH